MVAYSFKAQFAEPIVTLVKRQTVRGHRTRHALPGEPMQLYTAMRTKHCRKLLDTDPICLDVRSILIDLSPYHPLIIAGIAIDGVTLDDEEIEQFAVDDGFGSAADGAARWRMGKFWDANHGHSEFDGIVLRWRPA